MDFDQATEKLEERLRTFGESTFVDVCPFSEDKTFALSFVSGPYERAVFIEPVDMRVKSVNADGMPYMVSYRYGISVFVLISASTMKASTIQAMKDANRITRMLVNRDEEAWWRVCEFEDVSVAGILNVSDQAGGNFAGFQVGIELDTKY